MENSDIKVGVISLGCDKNRVDTENMLGHISERFKITNDPTCADVIIVNTCAFLQSSREEAIDTIFEAKSYNPKKLIVTGCLPQKFIGELLGEFSEVDAFVGTGRYEEMADILSEVLDCHTQKNYVTEKLVSVISKNRVITTPYHTAYLKIAEGCSNHCTYCLIPKIRGEYVSFPFDEVVTEAKRLVAAGVVELTLVAQDLTRYGSDTGKNMLVPLLRELSKTDAKWIRLLYCYPEGVTDELISEILTNDKLVKYIDIPMQHINDRILKLMGRRVKGEFLNELMRKLDGKITVRSTFIVGFPSETESEFLELMSFLKEHKLHNVGFFAYSKEEDTPAYSLKGQIDDEGKASRARKAYEVQREVVIENNKKMLGQEAVVLYDGIDENVGRFYGRTQSQALDVDGKVYLTTNGVVLDIGKFYRVKLQECLEYDFIGEVYSEFTK